MMFVLSLIKIFGNLFVLYFMVFYKLVIIIDFLKVGKFVKLLVINIIVLDLESFDVVEIKWVKCGLLIF